MREARVSYPTGSFVTIEVTLSQEEISLIDWLRQSNGFDALYRLRKMQAQRHQLAIVQFTEKGLQCREVGRLEG